VRVKLKRTKQRKQNQMKIEAIELEREEDQKALDAIIKKMSKDLRDAAKVLRPDEARFLVDHYYQMQENRIRSDGQIRSMQSTAEPHRVLSWLSDGTATLETQIKLALGVYSKSHPVGNWSRTVKGIGPVIAAGLLAHIDITKAPTVGHIWRFAGLDPTVKWNKSEKRPWNAALKRLCWIIGESFVKVSGYDDAFFGKIYQQRKAWEAQKNAELAYKDQALSRIEGPRAVGKTTEAYKFYSKGMLPPGHLHARAKRYAVKLFLSKWHEMAYREHYKTEPPKPYAIAILGHAHQI
jgi:hypothetical protein